MTCVACNIKRAHKLIQARIAMDDLDVHALLDELEMRWPGSFYYDMRVFGETADYFLFHRNTVPPHDPYHVHTFKGVAKNE